MNDVIKGLERIRNAAIGGIFFALITAGIGALNRLINDISVKIISLVIYLVLLIWGIMLIYQFFSGYGLIRRANLVAKLNQRIDEMKIYLVSSVILGFLYAALVVVAATVMMPFLMYVSFFVLLLTLILSFLAGYRSIQIKGILGVYANNAELKNRAVSMLFLFKIQIVNVILSNAASYFKSYLDVGYYLILIPSFLFSLYIFVTYVGILNLSIDVYKRIERDYV